MTEFNLSVSFSDWGISPAAAATTGSTIATMADRPQSPYSDLSVSSSSLSSLASDGSSGVSAPSALSAPPPPPLPKDRSSVVPQPAPPRDRAFNIDVDATRKSLPRHGPSVPRGVGAAVLAGSASLQGVGAGTGPLHVPYGHGHRRMSSTLSSIVSAFSTSLPRALSGSLAPLPAEAEEAVEKEFAEMEQRNSTLTHWVDDLQKQNQELQERQDKQEEEMEQLRKQLKAVKEQAERDEHEWKMKLNEVEERAAKFERKLEDKESELRGLNYEFDEIK